MMFTCSDCKAIIDTSGYCPECGSGACHMPVEQPKTAVFAEMRALEGQMLCIAGDFIKALTDQSIDVKVRWQAYVDSPDFIKKDERFIFHGYDAFCRKVWGKGMMDMFYHGNRYERFDCVDNILDSLLYHIENKLGVREEDAADHELLVEFRELVLEHRVESWVWDW